ncbi:MAG: DUF2207 domain-containing protein [Rhodocyclaceae bacterium]|nr:DUF2207 domain-containing protein [Rhodocyclaceae bacterium]
MSRLFFIAVLWALTFAPASAVGSEFIRHFDARIEVLADGSMEVAETISVNAEGISIKRGIYRDFPTIYRAWYGRRTVPFEVLSVKRNGQPEPSHQERRDNGTRLYIGRGDRNIPRGEHVHEIRYRTDWQLGFFADHDELYWNVTGNGWNFLIERATAMVVLPQRLPDSALTLEAYTGPQGAQGARLARKDRRGGPRPLRDDGGAGAPGGADHCRRLAERTGRGTDAPTKAGPLAARQRRGQGRPLRRGPPARLLPDRLAPLRTRPGRSDDHSALRSAQGRLAGGRALPCPHRLRRTHLRRRARRPGRQGAPDHSRGRRSRLHPRAAARHPRASRC